MRGWPAGGWATAACLVGAFFWAAAAPAADVDSRQVIEAPIVFAQVPADAEVCKRSACAGGMLRCDYGEGARIARLEADGQPRVLSAGFFDSACELDVSFDGERMVFAGKRARGDRWNIWEMRADGTGVRQITRDLGNCRSPAYQSSLYTLDSPEPWYQVMFVSDAAGEMNEFGSGAARSLYSCRLDGSGVRRLTMNLSDDLDPFQMDDGRVLLASWQRADLERGFRGRVSLFGVNTDGADYALFCGDEGARIKHMPCVTTGGLAVFVEADTVGWDGAGVLACVMLRRNLHSHRRITKDDGFVYHSPSPTRDGGVLVSRRPAGGSGTHGLYGLDAQTGRAELVFDDPAFHDLHARVLGPRREPDGRSSVVDETRYRSGKFYCLDAYNTDALMMPHIRPGMIKRLRVIEGVPLRAVDGSAYPPLEERMGIGGPGSSVNGIPPVVQKRLLGDVPVEADGSFQIEVPADVPVQLQTLDENGMALRTCGWIWVKPREPRGCIGCHEDPELSPENRLVAAMAKPGIKLMLEPGKRRTVDFRREVMPIIAQRCATRDCHGGGVAGPDLGGEQAGRFNRAYVSLLAGQADPASEKPVVGKYVHPGQARTSRLIWRLFGRNTSRGWDGTYNPGQRFPIMPPSGSGALTEDERAALVEWIDLGAQWDGIAGGNDELRIEN